MGLGRDWGLGASERVVQRVVGAGHMFGALEGSVRMTDGLGACPYEVGRVPKGRGLAEEVMAARGTSRRGGAR